MPFTVISVNTPEELKAVLSALQGTVTKVVAANSAATASSVEATSSEVPVRRPVGRPRKVRPVEAAVAPAEATAPAAPSSAAPVAEAAPEAAAPEAPAAAAPAAAPRSRTRNPHPSPFLWGDKIIDNRNNVLLLEHLLAIPAQGNGAEKTFRLNKITSDIQDGTAKSLFYADTKRLLALNVITRVEAGEREFIVKLAKGARAKLVREAAGGSNAEASAAVNAEASTDASTEASVDVSTEVSTSFGTEVSTSVSAEAEVITADSALDGAEA